MKSISRRLTLMFAATSAVVFLLTGFLLKFALHEALVGEVREELSLRASLLEPLLVEHTTARSWSQHVLPKLDAEDLPGSAVRLWIVSDDARFRYGEALPSLATAVATTGFTQISPRGRDGKLLVFSRSVPASGDRPVVTLVLARDASMFWRTLTRFKLLFIGLAVAGSALMAGLGWWIARVGLRPIGRLSKQARAIVPTQPLQRLATHGVPAELHDLGASFNGALDRLERAYKQLEAFNADVAHELRTPLMNLIGQTQVTLSRPRTCEAFEETLQSNLEELERLRSIVNDMLFLARADQGATPRDMQPVWLASEVQRIADFLEALIDEKQVTLRVEGDVRESIESALFRRAVSNLLTNAIEHSAAGDEIVVRIDREAQGACLSVSNRGPAIDARHLGHLFDRFYRVDAARCSSTGNHGLGLAIVKAIATMHRGTVFARSHDGTNTFGFTVASAAR